MEFLYGYEANSVGTRPTTLRILTKAKSFGSLGFAVVVEAC